VRHYRTHLFVFCALAVILLTGAQQTLHHVLVDKRFELLPRDATGQVVLVAIDSRSIEKISVWPWPRRLHAGLIRALDHAGANDIVFDVDFSAPSVPADDLDFQKALQNASGSVVLPTFKQLTQDRNGKSSLFVNRPLPQFSKDSWAATVNVVAGADGLVRRYSYGEVLDDVFHPSVAALLAGAYKPEQRSFVLDFSIRPDSVPQFSYVDVLNGHVGAAELKGKKVIIGGTAVELGDRFNVPNYGIMTGPMLQVLAAESLLQNRALQTSADFLTAGGLAVIALAMILLWRRLAAGRRLLLLIVMAIGIEVAALAVQANFAVVISTAAWQAVIAIYLVAVALDEIDIRGLLARIADRRFHRITMSVGDGLICADQKGTVTFCNPAAEVIFGYPSDQMIGRPFAALCCASDGTHGCAPFSHLDMSADLTHPSGGKTLEMKGKRSNGEIFPLEACVSTWSGADGVQYGFILRDITVRKREEEKVRYLAAYDTLTGLANRNTLRDHLDVKLRDDFGGAEVGLILVGIDKFKEINDTLGHARGDQLLRAFADNLSVRVPDATLVARFGGDVFAVVVAGQDVLQRTIEIADAVCGPRTETALSVDGRRLRVRCSAGISIYPKDCNTAEQLLANADLAFYRAKSAGGGHSVFFDQSIRSELESRLALEADLRRAIDRDEFVLFYQPQMDLRTGALVGVEALIRWRPPEKGLVSPGEFIPVLNASPMSDQVAHWVLQTACRQGRHWQQRGHELRISVNLSPSQIQSGDLAATVAQVLGDTSLPPALLELEVTEDILLSDDERAREIFSDIQKLGVHIAFDDFGTGYASLAYLKKFPLDRLKIDRSFVRDLLTDPSDAAIVDSTIRLGKQLGLAVIAEGIEDSPTAELLARMGCAEGQGYHFGRPMPVEDIEREFLHMIPALRAAG
jgi:diguanylate cyclase (GGDEF)-like protein/PAS domain S-box-containing protein